MFVQGVKKTPQLAAQYILSWLPHKSLREMF